MTFHTGNVDIGDDVWFGPGCRVIMPEGTVLTVEDSVDIAMEVLFIGGSHKIGLSERRAGTASRGDITVRRGAWIGARTTVLPGVEIASGAVLATCSVVKKDVLANCIYAGDPAVLIRNLPDLSTEH